MADAQVMAGIYLIVEFDWPSPFEDEQGRLARVLHDRVVEAPWIREVLAGSGGLGGELSSIWIFWLADYASLDRLMRQTQDPVAEAFRDFFGQMAAVRERIREEVVFISS